MSQHRQHTPAAPHDAPQHNPTTQHSSEVSEFSTRSRSSLLRMARAWEAQGSYNSATEVYLRIVKRYRGSGEAHDAFENLLGMASMYEQQGRYHLAMALFDEVEALM